MSDMEKRNIAEQNMMTGWGILFWMFIILQCNWCKHMKYTHMACFVFFVAKFPCYQLGFTCHPCDVFCTTFIVFFFRLCCVYALFYGFLIQRSCNWSGLETWMLTIYQVSCQQTGRMCQKKCLIQCRQCILCFEYMCNDQRLIAIVITRHVVCSCVPHVVLCEADLLHGF